MKNILFVASECVPFIKTGGLADVVGSLPKCFDKKKYDVRVMIPKYACIPDEWKNKMVYKTHFYIDSENYNILKISSYSNNLLTYDITYSYSYDSVTDTNIIQFNAANYTDYKILNSEK